MEFVFRMILFRACTDELMLKLCHSEQTFCLFVPELQLEIDCLAGAYWADGHSESPEADVIDHDEAPLPAKSKLERWNDWFRSGKNVQFSFVIHIEKT